uniref:Uncharacterized protein n=1 Tax=Alexandrium andersonii TaxID=327968 RepID=A0A7S2CTW4_9DINO|mmetsp:Transcript_43064/g.97753  ORF Transcript_43064/g.97753 Transcript_43064/m.97753 type:complete len:141 (+) Transcript_43064:1-423(+)
MLSFWMKEGDDWRLLSITNDPVNTKEAATMQLGEWAEAHMMPYQADPGATADPPVASKAELVDTGERFKDWRWTAAEVEKPFVQVAEFHYGSNSRLFFCDSETCSVSEGQLWTTMNTWTLRVWTLKDGKLSIGPGVDFQH